MDSAIIFIIFVVVIQLDMKKSILLIATFALATLLAGCELYNRGENKLPPTDPNEVKFEARFLIGDYYGDIYNNGLGNYYIYLSSVDIEEDGSFMPHGCYYILDITAPLNSFHNERIQIPEGQYTLDTEGSNAKFTFSAERSLLVETNNMGVPFREEKFDSGSMYVNNAGITLTVTIGDKTHIVEYNHSPYVNNLGANGTHSTLTEDRTLALKNHVLYYYPCGDYYNTGLDNWLLLIWPIDNEGDFLQFDIMTAKDSDNVYGTYNVGSSTSSGSFLKGMLTTYADETYMDGSWYYTSDYADIAPFVAGMLSVGDNGDGTTTLTFNMEDDRGNAINGTWSGTMELYPY